MRPIYRYLPTVAIISVAIGAAGYRYADYLHNPWTRDGQIRADVVQVAPRVSGPIVALPIHDNQEVRAGDLLFRIDPRTYDTALQAAQANYDQTLNDIEVLKKQVAAAQAGVAQADAAIAQAKSQVEAADSTLHETALSIRRNAALLQSNDISQARFDQVQRDYDVNLANKRQAEAALAEAESAEAEADARLAQTEANLGTAGAGNERLRAAAAQLESARLDLEFTEVRATVDGYVTNLRLRPGTQAVANQPMLALIDRSSFRIDAYFRETLVSGIAAGDQAVITLMAYPDRPIIGTVESIGWGIAKQDGATGVDLLPNVSPTFQWIRLAQRIPVRVHLGSPPAEVVLRMGQTASVLVREGSAGDPVAAPSILQ